MKKLHFLVASVVGAMALTATAEEKPQQSSADRIRVISADEVFDKDVVSSDNQEIGDIEYVLIRTDDAKIDYVVIDSEMKGSQGGGQDKLLLVPFDAIKDNMEGDQIQLQTTKDKIGNAPSVGSEQELATLIHGDKIQEVDAYWQPFSGGKEQPTGMMKPTTPSQPEERVRQREVQRTTPEKGLDTEAIDETPEAAKQRMEAEKQRMEAEKQRMQEQAELGSTPGQTPQAGTPQTGTPQTGTPAERMQQHMGETTAEAGAASYLLLGEHEHHFLKAGSTSLEKLDSLDVVATNQKNLGEIKNVVIDLDNGTVAYTLVSRGGFLGLGMNYVAVPMQAIELTDQQTLQLKVPFGTFQKMRGYMDDDVPRSVLRSDLERVYKQFKVTPYWKVEKEEVAARES